jgi:hypothetical protein
VIVRVDPAAGTVVLDEPAAFDGFKVVAPAGADEAAVAAALGADGRIAGSGHVWVRAAAVEGWAAGGAADGAVDDAWRAGFAKMLDYARTKGWTDESGEFVRAHIETAD